MSRRVFTVLPYLGLRRQKIGLRGLIFVDDDGTMILTISSKRFLYLGLHKRSEWRSLRGEVNEF